MVSTAEVNTQAALNAVHELTRCLRSIASPDDLSRAAHHLSSLKTSAHAQKSPALKLVAHAGERLISSLITSQITCSEREKELFSRLCHQLRFLVDHPNRNTSVKEDPYRLVRNLTEASNALHPPKPPPPRSALTRRLRRRGDHPREKARFIDHVLDTTLNAEMALIARSDHHALDQVARSLHALVAFAAFLGLESVVAHIRSNEERLISLLTARAGLDQENLSWLRGVLDHLRLLAVDPHRGLSKHSELIAEVTHHQLEQLVNISSQLRNLLHHDHDPAVRLHLDHLHTLSRDLLSVPILPIYQRLTQIARETADQLGRIIAISISGDHLSIPRTLAGLVEECAVHLIRNAIDHGIELPNRRRQVGKPENGTLMIAARTTERSLFIQITDDGAGIDPDQAVRIAVAKKLIPEHSNLEARDKLRLILIAGFTSATNDDRRGVGLDAVLDALERADGTLEIESTPGMGSSFVLRLPLAHTR